MHCGSNHKSAFIDACIPIIPPSKAVVLTGTYEYTYISIWSLYIWSLYMHDACMHDYLYRLVLYVTTLNSTVL